MKRFGVVVLMACAMAVPASAQKKISGKEACAKPDTQQSVDVSDVPGHMLMVTKSACTWPMAIEMAGLKVVSSVDVNTGELSGGMVKQHGYDIGTMDNGDTFSVSYSGTVKVAADGSAMFHGNWTFLKGTGKLKGIKGGGTFKGGGPADGSGTSDVVGVYSIAKPMMKPMAKPAS